MSESENTPETTQQVEEEEPRPEIEPQAVTQDRDRDESKLRKEKEASLVAESQPIKEEGERSVSAN